MNTGFFAEVARHTTTVVGVESSYTKPYSTFVLMLGPGQTTKVLIRTNQPAGQYYITARTYSSAPPNTTFNNTTTTAILAYTGGDSAQPKAPVLPAYNDTAITTVFSTGLKSSGTMKVHGPVTENLFITTGLGLFNCPPKKRCSGPKGREKNWTGRRKKVGVQLREGVEERREER